MTYGSWLHRGTPGGERDVVGLSRGRRALVLGGGGIAGAAWEIGLLSGLAAHGLDVRDADLVIGTSAGSVAGALLCSGRDLGELYADQLVPVPEGEPAVDLDPLTLMTAIGAALADTAGERQARARVGELALAADTVLEADRLAAIASRIGDPPWPAQRLVVTAVDTSDGAFATFAADPGVSLLSAVTASCAVPGIWPPITIGARRYMDGGVRSATNADLAAGCERVLVVAPVQGAPDNPLGPAFLVELDILRRDGEVTVVVADETARTAFGVNPLDPRTREPSARAGWAQAASVLARVRAAWV